LLKAAVSSYAALSSAAQDSKVRVDLLI
jgi:hypothetical protein